MERSTIAFKKRKYMGMPSFHYCQDSVSLHPALASHGGILLSRAATSGRPSYTSRRLVLVRASHACVSCLEAGTHPHPPKTGAPRSGCDTIDRGRSSRCISLTCVAPRWSATHDAPGGYFHNSSPCPMVATGDENGDHHPVLTRGVRLFSGQVTCLLAPQRMKMSPKSAVT
jgi:hypothetical protein